MIWRSLWKLMSKIAGKKFKYLNFILHKGRFWKITFFIDGTENKDGAQGVFTWVSARSACVRVCAPFRLIGTKPPQADSLAHTTCFFCFVFDLSWQNYYLLASASTLSIIIITLMCVLCCAVCVCDAECPLWAGDKHYRTVETVHC